MNRNIPLPIITGGRFVLRPFHFSDAESLQESLNDPRVARKVSHIPYPYTRQHADAWVRKMESRVGTKSTRIDFAIDVDSKVAGSVAFINVDDHRAQVSYWLSPAHWGNGYMTEALGSLLQFGFDTLGLVRIFAYVYENNTASARVLERSGFTYEGTHRKEWHRVIDGEDVFFDSKYYSIIDTDWARMTLAERRYKA